LFFLIGILFLGGTSFIVAQSQVTVSYAGNAGLADYRTTTVLKPLDADGDNVFGTTGFVMYGTDVIGSGDAGSVITGDPLSFVSGTRRTLLSLPSWLTLRNNG